MKNIILFVSLFFSLNILAHDGEDHRHLDPALIRGIFQSHTAQFKVCYQKELDISKESFDFSSKISFKITGDGSTKEVHFEESDADNATIKKIQSCIVKVTKGISFPKPEKGGPVSVSQPLNFRAKH